MAQILVVKPGTLNNLDKSALRKSGVICVEAENPNEVKLIQPDGLELAAGDLFLAAMRGINNGSFPDAARNAFAKALGEMAELRWSFQEEPRP